MSVRTALSCLLLCMLGCGGASQEARPPQSASPGLEDETVTAAEPAPAAEKQEPAPKLTERASGPGSLSLDAKVKGQSVPASVRLLADDGHEVASGKTGQAIEAPSGTYTLEVQIDDAAAMLDRPMQRRQLTINAGDELHETAEFPWTMIQLNVRVNGKLDRGAEVILLRDGNEVATVKSGASHVAISPGRYGAVVKTRGTKIEVKEMLLPEGATESKPIDVHM